MKAPARHIEKTPPPIFQPIFALNACAPPLAKVPPKAEAKKLLRVIPHPCRKAKVVILGRDEPRARSGKDHRWLATTTPLRDHQGIGMLRRVEPLGIPHDIHLGIRAVDFLRHDHLPRQARHFRKLLKFHYFTFSNFISKPTTGTCWSLFFSSTIKTGAAQLWSGPRFSGSL